MSRSAGTLIRESQDKIDERNKPLNQWERSTSLISSLISYYQKKNNKKNMEMSFYWG